MPDVLNFDEALKVLITECNSYTRLPSLIDMVSQDEIDYSTFLRLLGEVWQSCDNIGENQDLLIGALWFIPPEYQIAGTEHIPLMMTIEEQSKLASLPERVQVFRGCGPDNKYGFSWSLDREVAAMYPLLARFYQADPILLTAAIDRKGITALKLDRGEAEVILFSGAVGAGGRIQEETLPGTPKSKIDFNRLREKVLSDYKGDCFSVHGVFHWRRVEAKGLRIAVSNGASADVVRLFAIFHDSCRTNDDFETTHGERAAEYARSLRGEFFDIDDCEFERLAVACSRHTFGERHADPTIGACWDADRLDLNRVGITPDPDMMSTAEGKKMAESVWLH